MADVMALFKSDNMETEGGNSAQPLTSGKGREPKRKPKAGDPGSLGDQAFMDACIIVGIAWLVLLFFAWSLRGHNI